jgi:hypothetical protein
MTIHAITRSFECLPVLFPEPNRPSATEDPLGGQLRRTPKRPSCTGRQVGSDVPSFNLGKRCEAVDLAARDTDIPKLEIAKLVQSRLNFPAFMQIAKCTPATPEKDRAGQRNRPPMIAPSAVHAPSPE